MKLITVHWSLCRRYCEKAGKECLIRENSTYNLTAGPLGKTSIVQPTVDLSANIWMQEQES